MKHKLLRIASYVSIATVGWIGGVLFSSTLTILGFLLLTAAAGVLLTAVSVLFLLESQRDMTAINTLEMRCKVLERRGQMLVDQHVIHRHLVEAFDGEGVGKSVH